MVVIESLAFTRGLFEIVSARSCFDGSTFVGFTSSYPDGTQVRRDGSSSSQPRASCGQFYV